MRGLRKGGAQRAILVPPVSPDNGMLAQNQIQLERETIATALNELCDWDVFWTGTTRYICSRNSLQRAFEDFMGCWPNVSYIYALEPHGGKGMRDPDNAGWHVHTMFDKPSDKFSWKVFWRGWFDRFGVNHSSQIRKQADVSGYVAKYVVKEHLNIQRTEREEIWWNVYLSRKAKRARGLSTEYHGSSEFTVKGAVLKQMPVISAAEQEKLEREAFDWKWQKKVQKFKTYKGKPASNSDSSLLAANGASNGKTGSLLQGNLI